MRTVFTSILKKVAKKMVIICKDGLLISNKLVVRPLKTSFILHDNDPSIPLLLFD